MIPTDPLDYPLLGIQWNDQLFIDKAVCFGLRTRSMICQRVTNAIGYIMQAKYGTSILQYVDDLVGIKQKKDIVIIAYERLSQLTDNLGMQAAAEKLCTPSTCMEFIVVIFDMESM